MQKAERVGRFVGLTLGAMAAVALAGCGGSDSGISNAATSTSTPTTVADTASAGGSSSSGSTSGSGSTTPATPPTSSNNGSIAFSWVPPTENSNGSPLTNLAGYKIHYGTASQDYSEVVALNNPSLNRYVLDSLPSGTYYFAITAYNSAGVESTLSGEITATLN